MQLIEPLLPHPAGDEHVEYPMRISAEPRLVASDDRAGVRHVRDHRLRR